MGIRVLWLDVYLSLSLSSSISLTLCLYICLSVCLSLFLCVCVCLSLSLSLSCMQGQSHRMKTDLMKKVFQSNFFFSHPFLFFSRVPFKISPIILKLQAFVWHIKNCDEQNNCQCKISDRLIFKLCKMIFFFNLYCLFFYLCKQ